jgi:hypothetical protein
MAKSSLLGLKTIGKIAPLGGTSKPKPPVPKVAEMGDSNARPDLGFRRVTVAPTGFEIYGWSEKREITGGPWPPPVDFDSPSTSFLEWVWYWASFVALKIDKDPRQGPFAGYPPIFEYQVPDDPTDVRAAGSGVSDFLYYLGTGTIIVRIDSYYYHTAADPGQVARDNFLKTHGAGEHNFIISAYDVNILGDPSGRAAVAACARALKGEQPINPRLTGLTYPTVDAISRITP